VPVPGGASGLARYQPTAEGLFAGVVHHAGLKRIGKYVATGRVGAGAKLMHDYSITSCW
jgi:hypothetical protein